MSEDSAKMIDTTKGGKPIVDLDSESDEDSEELDPEAGYLGYDSGDAEAE